MKYLGIDPSTKSGFVLLDHEGQVLDTRIVRFEKISGFKRLQLIANATVSLVEQWSPDRVAIEGYAYGNVHTLVTLVEIGSIIRYCLYGKVPWVDIPPTVLKRWCTGRGNAKKEEVARYVKERWGFESKSDDIVDAYVLARMAKEDFK